MPLSKVPQLGIAANVAGNGPAFSAYSNGQSCTTSTNVLAAMSTERYDSDGSFNNTGSTVNGVPAYAFKPTVAGYYLVTGSVQYQGPNYAGYYVCTLFKNGSGYMETVNYGWQYSWSYFSTVIYLNGSTDYLQLYANQLQGASQNCAANMSAVLVKAA